MKQEIKDIHEATQEIAQDLSGYATRAAMALLTSNWTDAVNDRNPQFTVSSAVNDIDEVIGNLVKLKLRLSSDPLANRKMRVALGLEVDVPAWDSLSDDDRETWVESYRARHDYLPRDADVTNDAKDEYLQCQGIEPPDPLAYTRQ